MGSLGRVHLHPGPGHALRRFRQRGVSFVKELSTQLSSWSDPRCSVDTLDKIVREEEIQHVVVAGADVAMPILRAQLPKELADKIVEIGPHEDGESGSFVERTMAALREKDAETDVEKVQELMDAWKSGGLGVAGPEATLSAFQLGQVDELIITGSPDTLKSVQELPEDAAPGDVQVMLNGVPQQWSRP